MRLTKNNSPKSYTIYYLPQEIKETMVTEVSYLPITRERLEQFFKDAASKRKPKLVKKRKQSSQGSKGVNSMLPLYFNTYFLL